LIEVHGIDEDKIDILYNPIDTTRFNTTVDSLETWDGAAWVSGSGGGNTITPGTITDQQITPDGTSNTYTLSQSASSAGVLVSINGVTQMPTTAYSVTGNSITFTQTPLTQDLIDIRFISYTTTVSSLTNSSGNAVVITTSAGNVSFTANGNLVTTMSANLVSVTGNIYTSGIIQGNVYTVATLPLANVAGAGSRAFVNNSNTTVFYNIANAGGSNTVPVFSDGTNWRIG
jgi:hypothetical protein